MNLPSAVLLTLLSASPAAPTEPLCDKREPCRVAEALPAGQVGQGRPLQVKRLSLGWTDLETGAEFSGKKFESGGRKAQGAAGEDPCEATEWWLVRPQKPAQLLLSSCDNHHGAVREEKVEVGNNSLRYTQAGARRSDRWKNTRELHLDPLRLSGHSEQTFWQSSSGQERADGFFWDDEQLRGRIVRAPSDCQPGETPLAERSLPYMPRVEMDKAYLEGGWKQTDLGSGEGACNLPAESFLLGQEKVSGPEDASLKALLVAEDTLIVQVLDDVWTGPSDNWLKDDHVEVWLAPLPPQVLNGCGGKLTKDQKPAQWGIRIADGKVFPAYGAPKQQLQVERAELPGRKGYRLKVKLPTPFLGITVAYSDSDEGKQQESLVATSPLKFGRTETLNPIYPVLAEEATCEARNGRLSIVRPELQAEPGKAVLQPQ